MRSLQFTASGAAASPEVVQLRLSAHFANRIQAGAPVPARDLSNDEVVANLRYFSVDRSGPRTRPCTALVLSGEGLADREGLSVAIEAARALGYERVTLHLDGQGVQQLPGSSLDGLCDAVSVALDALPEVPLGETLGALQNTTGDRPFVTVVLRLNAATLPHLFTLCAALPSSCVDRVVLTWPFIASIAPPPAEVVVAALPGVLSALEASGIQAGVKGLPLCVLGDLAHYAWKSGNRFYVDANHQKEGALLFFPEVVQFKKPDVCRHCTVNHQCDGAPAAWLDSGLVSGIGPV